MTVKQKSSRLTRSPGIRDTPRDHRQVSFGYSRPSRAQCDLLDPHLAGAYPQAGSAVRPIRRPASAAISVRSSPARPPKSTNATCDISSGT